jgi:hypothetical protein
MEFCFANLISFAFDWAAKERDGFEQGCQIYLCADIPKPGLPDGFFSNQKFQFGLILEGPRLENVNIINGHLEYFTDIWYIFPVLISCTKKNLSTMTNQGGNMP